MISEVLWHLPEAKSSQEKLMITIFDMSINDCFKIYHHIWDGDFAED